VGNQGAGAVGGLEVAEEVAGRVVGAVAVGVVDRVGAVVGAVGRVGAVVDRSSVAVLLPAG
jgi:hypothetical protein